MTRITRRAALALPVAAAAGSAQAQHPFPNRPVTVIVPFPPGGATDLIARPLGAALQRVWNQGVVLQNRGGAGGGIGMAAAAVARPDGYTGLIAHVSYSSIPAADALFGRPPSFDRAALAPVALLTADPLIIVVKADAPWRSWLELLEDAKRRPGDIAYGSSGPYSAVHLPFEMLAHAGGIRLNHVPYSGGGPAITAVLGGQVAATASTPSVVSPYIRSGEMRALVSSGARRVALLPDVPTGMELGFPTVEFYLWVGLFTQTAVEAAIQARLREGVAAAVREPEMQRQLDATGMVIDHREGAAFQAFLEADRVRVEAAVQRIGKVE
ncbi:MAG TPA: tripartite tricarboxylate transporter substrate binding protein [Roseomonas sp.]|jgi:tripartite-type tricarboxylate transporter receptor subunit TctC